MTLQLLSASSFILSLFYLWRGEATALGALAKPAAMVPVIAWVVLSASADGLYSQLILLGLICSVIGDVFLLDKKKGFLNGLVSFLIAHLLYIGAFAVRPGGFQVSVAVAVFVAVLSLVILSLVWSRAGEFKAGIFAYLIAIDLCVIGAVSSWLKTPQPSYLYTAAGMVLFMISDSALAVGKFRTDFPFRNVCIFATYISAQWLLALSIG